MMQANLKAEKYLANLVKYQQEYSRVPVVSQRLQAVRKTVTAFQKKRVPQFPLPKLELSENLLFAMIDCYPDILEVESFLNDLRQCVIENFGIWHIFSAVWIRDLKKYLNERATLQVMAGNGVLASQIENISATDNLDWQGQDITQPDPWTKIERLDALKAVKKYYRVVDVIIMEWSPDGVLIDEEIRQFLRTVDWPGELLVIGEKDGATNSTQFWQNANLTVVKKLNINHQPFDFIMDQVFKVK